MTVKTICMISAALSLGVCVSAACGQATQPTTRPAALPADQMLTQMLLPTGPAAKPLQPVKDGPAIDKTSVNAVSPAAQAVSVLREGTYIVDRTGRLTKSADKQAMEFTFDADGGALRDPPLLLLPNLKLMAMEAAVSSTGRDIRFRVTGMVTEYRGRNYLLLEKVVVIPDVNQQF